MKIYGTRKQIAQELWPRLAKGPELSLMTTDIPFETLNKLTAADVEAIENWARGAVRRWLATWIAPEVSKLVPKEFRQPKEI